jgi:hypothetical protein
MSRGCVSAAGQKKGIFRLQRAKAGQERLAGRALPRHRGHEIFSTQRAAGVSGTDRCYEPAGTQFVAAIPKAGAAIAGSDDHEFVINGS